MSFLRSVCCLPVMMACLGASCERAPDESDPEYPPPKLVAHRGGTADRPENTLVAIEAALRQRSDMIWLSVQLSLDGVPVLYRPNDLSALTNGSGKVADYSAAALGALNAGWSFVTTGTNGMPRYPYHDSPVGIPTLRQALRAIPANIQVILDMKAMPAQAQTAAVAKVLDAEDAWGRVLIYSTEADYQRTFSAWPKARLFESRDVTRRRLSAATLGQSCDAPSTSGVWAGFELRRDVEVVETFTLGEGRSPVRATFWTKASVHCYRSKVAANLVAFGVNDQASYCEAKRLGLDAVMVDSPEKMAGIRTQVEKTPALCHE